jgi:hypothetical protein
MSQVHRQEGRNGHQIPQEIKHAPALQSCAADLNLWASQIPGWPIPTLDQLESGTKSLTVDEMEGRVSSMNECFQSYPLLQKSSPGDLPAALSLMGFYQQEVQLRYFSFLVRHHLLDKFKEEDNAALR